MENKKEMKKIRRKVVCVYGTFDDKNDFVLEPVCSNDCKCEECKNAFWIEGVKEKCMKFN